MLTGDEAGEDFIHKSLITMKAALNTRREQKIRMFARLLAQGVFNNRDKDFYDTDQYEEYLKILDSLSLREIQLLEILYKYSISVPRNQGENDLQWTNKFWENFIKEAITVLNMTTESKEVFAILGRLSRTGCFTFMNGAYISDGGDQGKLTSIYYELREVIKESTKPSRRT